MGESQVSQKPKSHVSKTRPTDSSASKKRHSSKKSAKSSRTSSKSGRRSRSKKGSRRSSKKSSKSSKKSGRSTNSRRSGNHSSSLCRSRGLELWNKLQKATEEKTKRAQNKRKMAGIMQAVMIIMIFLALCSVFTFTLIPWLKTGVLDDMSYHIYQCSAEIILILTAIMMVGSPREAYSDLHTSLVIAAGSWNCFIIFSGWTSTYHFVEDCTRINGDAYCPFVQATVRHHVSLMNLVCLVCHVIALLLTIGAIIFTSSSRKAFAEISALYKSLEQALRTERKMSERRKKARRSRSKSSSRRSRSKKSTRSTKSKKSSKSKRSAKSSKKRNQKKGKKDRLQKV